MTDAPAAKGTIPAVPTSIDTPVPTTEDGAKENAAAGDTEAASVRCIAQVNTIPKTVPQRYLGWHSEKGGMTGIVLPKENIIATAVAVLLIAVAGSMAIALVIAQYDAPLIPIRKGTIAGVRAVQGMKRS